MVMYGVRSFLSFNAVRFCGFCISKRPSLKPDGCNFNQKLKKFIDEIIDYTNIRLLFIKKFIKKNPFFLKLLSNINPQMCKIDQLYYIIL